MQKKEMEIEVEKVVKEIMNKPKPKVEFSKRLAQVITALFLATWLVGWFAWFTKGQLPNEMLEFITMPFSVVITGYFAKAGYENSSKIKNSHFEE